MAGIRHTTPADGTFTTEGASAWNGDEAHTLSDVASQTDLNALSNAVSVLSNTNSSEHAGLSNRITSVAGLAGGGSVTSAEVQAVSVAAQSAINTVSNALSVLSNTNSSEHAALSARITSVAGLGGGSVTSAEVQAVSAAAQSAVNTVSAAVNVVSNATSAEIVNRVSADNVLSANIASVDGRATSIANALSALSNANSASHVSIDGRVTSVANAVSVLSQALSVLSNTNSAAHVSIDGRVTSVANAVSVVSNALSVLSQTNSVDHAALSNRITSVAGLGGGGSVTSAEVFNAISSLADRVSANSGVGGGGGSVTSNELSAVALGLSTRLDSALVVVNNLSGNADSIAANLSDLRSDHGVLSDKASNLLSGLIALSGRVDTLSAAVGAVSNYASVASNAASVADAARHAASNYASVVSNYASQVSATAVLINAPQIRLVSNVQSVAGSALVDISGLVLTVAADQTWEIAGMLAFSTSATTVGLRLGYSVPPLSTPRFGYMNRASGGQSAGFAGGAGQLQVSGASVFMSITGAGPAGGVYVVDFKHVMNVASAGTVRLMYAGIASTTASPIHLMPGSYLKAIRLK